MNHDIRSLTREEAYPASAGQVCRVCGMTTLLWGGFGLAGAKPLADTECKGATEATSGRGLG